MSASWTGRLTGIYLARDAKGALESAASARAVEGKGLEGDRYAAGAGTFSTWPGGGKHVTLIEEEALEAIALESKMELPAASARRNLTTRGVPLNHLVGKQFRVGAVTLAGIRLCEPCEHMEGLSGVPGVRAALLHRGGLRAVIVSGGELRVGDEISEV
jgi:MOSC domain-containing protein YiiM